MARFRMRGPSEIPYRSSRSQTQRARDENNQLITDSQGRYVQENPQAYERQQAQRATDQATGLDETAKQQQVFKQMESLSAQGRVPNYQAVYDTMFGGQQQQGAGYPVDPRTGRIIRERTGPSANVRHGMERSASGRPRRMWQSDGQGGGQWIEGVDVDYYDDTMQHLLHGAPLPAGYMGTPQGARAMAAGAQGRASMERELGQQRGQLIRVQGEEDYLRAVGPAAIPGMEAAQARMIAGTRGDPVAQERVFNGTTAQAPIALGVPTENRGAAIRASQEYLDALARAKAVERQQAAVSDQLAGNIRQNYGSLMDAVQTPNTLFGPSYQMVTPRVSPEQLSAQHAANQARTNEMLAEQYSRISGTRGPSGEMFTQLPLTPEEEFNQQQTKDAMAANQVFPLAYRAYTSGTQADLEAATAAISELDPGAQTAVYTMLNEAGADPNSYTAQAIVTGLTQDEAVQSVQNEGGVFAGALFDSLGGDDFIALIGNPGDGMAGRAISATAEQARQVILRQVTPQLRGAVNSMVSGFGRDYAISQLAKSFSGWNNPYAANRVATWIVDG